MRTSPLIAAFDFAWNKQHLEIGDMLKVTEGLPGNNMGNYSGYVVVSVSLYSH